MLSRTADHLFWMSRYTERAENTARILDVNYQTSLLPQSAAVAQVGWEGLLRISELMPAYQFQYGEVTPQRRAALHGARRGQPVEHRLVPARGPRKRPRRARRADHRILGNPEPDLAGSCSACSRPGFERDPSEFFEWVKFRSHLSRGVAIGTMLQDEAFHFYRMGTFLERADNTARLIDVKFHAVERLLRQRQRSRPGVRLLPLERDPAQRQRLRGLPQGLPRR
jgi:uncharacterized alpha-E superfamily protein